MSEREKLLLKALEENKESYLSGVKRPILKYKINYNNSVKGYSCIDFYFCDKPTPLFSTRTRQIYWHSFAQKILDEMQKIAIKWKRINS